MTPTTDAIRLVNDTDPHPWWLRYWWRLSRVARRPLNRWRFRSFGAKSRIDWPSFVVGGKGIEVGAKVIIGRAARLEAHFVHEGGVRIKIGDGCRLAPHVHIGAAQLVDIGPRCGIGSFTWITDHDHDISNPLEDVVTNRRVRVAPTVLEEGVYVGERVAILRGVRIGRGSVIGTNSVVTKDVPEYCVAVGVPARVVSRFDVESSTWCRVAANRLEG